MKVTGTNEHLERYARIESIATELKELHRHRRDLQLGTPSHWLVVPAEGGGRGHSYPLTLAPAIVQELRSLALKGVEGRITELESELKHQ